MQKLRFGIKILGNDNIPVCLSPKSFQFPLLWLLLARIDSLFSTSKALLEKNSFSVSMFFSFSKILINTFSTWRALPTRLVFEKFEQPCYGINHVCALIQYYNRCGAECRFLFHEIVEFHQDRIADFFRDDRSRSASRNDPQQIIPTSLDSSCMRFN